MAHQRDDVAVGRIECDHGAASPAERLLGSLLRRQVDRQHQVRTGLRRRRAQLGLIGALALHRATLGVDEDLAVAVVAVQLRLVGALDAELADQRGAGVAGAVDALEVLLADRGDVAERVHAEIAEGIVARLARTQIDTRELVAVHGEAADLLVAEPQADGHAVEAAARQHGAPRIVDLLRRQQAERGETPQRVAEIGGLLADQFQLVGGLVVDQHRAIAVEDQAAACRYRVETHAIAL